MASERQEAEVLNKGRLREEAFFSEVVIPAFEALKSRLEEDVEASSTYEPNVVAISIRSEEGDHWRCEVNASPQPGQQPFVEAISHYEGKPERHIKESLRHDISKEEVLDWLSVSYQKHLSRK